MIQLDDQFTDLEGVEMDVETFKNLLKEFIDKPFGRIFNNFNNNGMQDEERYME